MHWVRAISSVYGIHHVINILEKLLRIALKDRVCRSIILYEGCLGGPLTVVNPFVARTALKQQREKAKLMDFSKLNKADNYQDLLWTEDMEYKSILKLDEDMKTAIRKMQKLEVINEGLPGLDCGACGAPSCRALAEDIVRELACETDCIFKLREKVSILATQMKELDMQKTQIVKFSRCNPQQVA